MLPILKQLGLVNTELAAEKSVRLCVEAFREPQRFPIAQRRQVSIHDLTYGELPTYQDFSDAFDRKCLGGIFRIRGMDRLNAIYPNGDVDMDKETMWKALLQCERDYLNNHDLGDFAYEVLGRLGFKMI